MSAVQLDILDVLAMDERTMAREQHARRLMREHLARYHGARTDTYADRYEFGCLRVGEACPGCGHIFTRGGDDSSGDHAMPLGATECTGRRAYRQHAQHAYMAWGIGGGTEAAFRRAVAAAAPCWTADERAAWLADPHTHLFGEVTA